ncbi:1-deoxy-D-xylulose-5-phosphate reductoisomerase [Nakamurella silvestris]|nr:1-deoxy-D-xylulose-5-phosphate reductoisomerase [Nakamurella silvestris]
MADVPFEFPTFPRRVVILGSTGSVGTQALDIIRLHPDLFEVVGLSAGGSSLELLTAQATEFGDARIAVATGTGPDLPGRTVLTGPEAATELVATTDADLVLNAITGSVGLGPTLAALAAGRVLALANKESLVAGGSLVTGAAAPGQIVPVDSEHSALAQALRSGTDQEVAKLVLTASGGPFRGRTRQEVASATRAQALAHPTWAMGPVVTVNSATLVNKGLEVIEARLLFDIDYPQIDVVVHPQSVIHSMVTFVDGSTMAQASPPDMHLPVALGLGWPHRLSYVAKACDFGSPATWTFEPVDHEAFPALNLARAAGTAGGLMPAVFNAANEEAVGAFLDDRLTFGGITRILEEVLAAAESDFTRNPSSIDDVLDAEDWARSRARHLLPEHSTVTQGATR